MLTVWRRDELNRAVQTRAIRGAIFEVGYLAVFLFAVNKAAELWPNYRLLPLVIAAIIFIGLVWNRYRERKSIASLKEQLDEDLNERKER